MNTSSSKTFYGCLLTILLAGGTVLFAQDPSLRKEPREERRTLTVMGQGEATSLPDQAVVRLGTTVQSEEASTAQTKVNEVMQKTIDQIEKAGIKRRLIQTSGLTLTPIYSSQQSGRNTEPKLVGYRAGNVITVTIEDIKLVGKIIDAGLGAGANRLEGVTFSLKDESVPRIQALDRALQDAGRKAHAMAKSLELGLGGVREVVEGGVQVFPQERYGMAVSRGMMADGMQTPVEPGEIRVQASVTIHYDLRDAK